MDVGKDINEEYERIFGAEQRETLFSPDDEEYQALRQSIVDAKREYNPKNTLPFAGIMLYTYDVFKRIEIAKEAEKEGYRIFYIKKYKGRKLVTYAAGYFNFRISKFVVLNESFFTQHDYFSYLNNHYAPTKRIAILQNYRVENGMMTQLKKWTFESASLAASYFLGKKSTFSEWKDGRGKTLDAYYQMYKYPNIDEKEDLTFPDYESPNQNSHEQSQDSSLQTPKTNGDNTTQQSQWDTTSTTDVSHHIFSLHVAGRCRAKGYFDESARLFVILKGSVFNNKCDSSFDNTALGLSRRNFIKACCIELPNYYLVTKDTSCKSASSAASYLIGNDSSYSLWEDSCRRRLSDVYPNYTEKTNEKGRECTSDSEHLFFINSKTYDKRYCNVSGSYDGSSRRFTLKAGSILCSSTDQGFDFTPLGVARRNFLNKFCTEDTLGFRLKSDQVLQSPITAASYAVGSNVDGWKLWKDKDGKSLEKRYERI